MDVSTSIKGAIKSSSSGTWFTSSTAYVDVTNLSITFKATGRPVWVGLVGIQDTSGITVKNVDTSSATVSQADGNVQLIRDATVIGASQIQISADESSTGSVSCTLPPSTLWTIDAPAAGTVTYKLQAKIKTGDDISVFHTKLVVVEL